MARRVFIGNSGGAFIGRVSRAGYDALTAGPEGLIFDAADIPLRRAGGGEITAASDPSDHYGSPTPNAKTTTIPHYITQGDLVIRAIAQSLGRTATGEFVGQWRIYQTGLVSGLRRSIPFHWDNTYVHGTDRWLTPFYFDQEIDSDDHRYGGWVVRWDYTNIYFDLYTAVSLKIRWEGWVPA